MPRGARILITNTYYHIINRGNQKQDLFIEKGDFEQYLNILRHYKEKYHFKLFGYCLMPNHIHLLICPKQVNNLSKIMQGLTQTYTFWFNKKYKKVGHLWQGRFKSMVIKKGAYFLECIYYIEANPVRAKLTDLPQAYPWSSYNSRIFGNTYGLLDLPDST